jgi:hypothetical protein
MPKVMKKKKVEEPNDDEIKHEHDIYDNLNETQDFIVADGFVSFTRTFRYLGSLISYNLRDDEDIKARIAAANASMGALKEIWSNTNLDTYNKYLLFRAIPMNLLLWGCETWSLRQSLLDKLEVFLHKSIRRILKISMFQVKDEKIRNEQVRNTFYAMPCVKNTIAARQLDFIGKLIRGPHDQPARRMITSCCNETRRVGRPQTTEKNCIVKNLRLLFKDVPLKHIDHHGSLKHWIHEASNEEYWNQLIKRLTHPETPLPERPEEWGPLPSWQARHANTTNEDESDNSDDEDEHNNNQDNAENEEPLPPRRPPPRNQPPPPSSQSTERIYDPKLWLNNPEMCEMIGHSLGPSLQILDLGLGASEIEAKMKYRQLSRIYHPDKNNQTITGLTTEEATEFFKLLNNANEYLKEIL